MGEAIESERCVNLFALRKAKNVYNFGLSECNRVKDGRASVAEGILSNKCKFIAMCFISPTEVIQS